MKRSYTRYFGYNKVVETRSKMDNMHLATMTLAEGGTLIIEMPVVITGIHLGSNKISI